MAGNAPSHRDHRVSWKDRAPPPQVPAPILSLLVTPQSTVLHTLPQARSRNTSLKALKAASLPCSPEWSHIGDMSQGPWGSDQR